MISLFKNIQDVYLLKSNYLLPFHLQTNDCLGSWCNSISLWMDQWMKESIFHHVYDVFNRKKELILVYNHCCYYYGGPLSWHKILLMLWNTKFQVTRKINSLLSIFWNRAARNLCRVFIFNTFCVINNTVECYQFLTARLKCRSCSLSVWLNNKRKWIIKVREKSEKH